MLVLGIDPGTATTGYGLVRDTLMEALSGFAAELATGADPMPLRRRREAI